MSTLDETGIATSFTALIQKSLLCLHRQYSLWIVTFGAQNKLPDESIKQILKFASIVRPIHDEAFILEVELSLRPKFTSKVLGWIYNINSHAFHISETETNCKLTLYITELTSGWSTQSFSNFHHVDNDRLNSVAFALYLSKQLRHFVAIKHIADTSIHV